MHKEIKRIRDQYLHEIHDDQIRYDRSLKTIIGDIFIWQKEVLDILSATGNYLDKAMFFAEEGDEEVELDEDEHPKIVMAIIRMHTRFRKKILTFANAIEVYAYASQINQDECLRRRLMHARTEILADKITKDKLQAARDSIRGSMESISSLDKKIFTLIDDMDIGPDHGSSATFTYSLKDVMTSHHLQDLSKIREEIEKVFLDETEDAVKHMEDIYDKGFDRYLLKRIRRLKKLSIKIGKAFNRMRNIHEEHHKYMVELSSKTLDQVFEL